MKSSRRRCWAEVLGGCDGLSKEHVFSRGAFQLPKGAGIRVTGFAPIPDGPIGPDSPKAKVLCRQHNSDLEAVDSEVAMVTKELVEVASNRQSRVVSVSGLRFERWVFKVAVNFMAAGYAGGGPWSPDEALVRFIFGQSSLLPPLGIYMLADWKMSIEPQHQHIGFRPVYLSEPPASPTLVGGVVTYHGLTFLACMHRDFLELLSSVPGDFPIAPDLMSYRPNAVVARFENPDAELRMRFDWRQ